MTAEPFDGIENVGAHLGALTRRGSARKRSEQVLRKPAHDWNANRVADQMQCSGLAARQRVVLRHAHQSRRFTRREKARAQVFAFNEQQLLTA